MSWSDAIGNMSYLVSAQYGPYNRGNQVERFDEYLAPLDDELTEFREIDVPMLNSALVLNGSTSWTFDSGALLNLNARIADRDEDRTETTRVFLANDPDVTTLEERSLEEGLDWELGGDFEQRFGPGTLQTRAIYTHKDEDDTQRISQTSTDSGNVPAQSQVETAAVATEAILRGSYSWPLTAAQNLELGIEGARNTLEKDVALYEVLPDGTLVPVQLFNADSDVNEDRFEFFSTHFWQLRDDLVLESALNIEHSKIAQEGLDVENARSFTYLKPRFDLRWDLSDSDQVRSSLERTVSQLDFGDFVANFDSDNDQVAAGNPELEPEKAWEYQLTYERRLPDDTGLLSAQLFYNDIEDHIDNIRVADNVSAAGNIGDAERYGLTLKGSLRLEGLGLEGAVLDASYTVQDSETVDPFVGTPRKMSNVRDQEYRINFRHDIAAWRFNYNIEVNWDGDSRRNDITYRQISAKESPNTHLNMQYRLTDRIVLWFDTRLVFDGHSQRTRRLYVDDVADDNLLRTEVRDQYFRRELILGLRGQF
ncbi:MAG: outer membrane beta-barrel protein [Woeseiaceae bacterium]|nr:outer membrane beta-barrel protein [Woeseiaceae bacterium]